HFTCIRTSINYGVDIVIYPCENDLNCFCFSIQLIANWNCFVCPCVLVWRILKIMVDEFMIRFGVNVSLDFGFPLIGLIPPKTAEQKLARKNKLKAKSTLMLAILDEHLLKFHACKDAKSLWEAIKNRFGGNKESKKMQKTIFKQNYENFAASSQEGLDKTYDRAPRNQGNRNRDAPTRNAPVDTSTTNALVVQDGIGGYDWSFQAEEKLIDFALMAYTSQGSSSLSGSDSKARIVVHEKNEAVYEEDIAFLKYDVQVKDISIKDLKNQLENALKQKDDLKLKLEKFETSFKNLTKLIIVKKCYRQDCSESDKDDNQVNNRFKKGEGYHAVPPPYTGNYMPPRVDLSFAGLDNSVFKFKKSNSEGDNVFKPKEAKKTVKPSLEKIEFVNARNTTVENENKAKKPRKFSQSPRATVLTKSGQVPVNTAKQSSYRAAASISIARHVNTTASRPHVNDALPTTYSYFKSHSLVRRPFNKKSTAKTNNFNEKVNTAKVNNVTTAGPKAVVSAAEGNSNNVVKSSTCWIWRPKRNLIDHVSKDSGSYTFKRFNYGNPQYALQDQGIFDNRCSIHMTGNKSYITDYQEIDGEFVAFGGNAKGGKITGKRKIRTGKLDFEDVYFVKELKFNLFSISQMRDTKNSVLFTDTECIENQIDHKVKTIRCDNGTEFKNRIKNEFCEIKGIRREFSVARTPQQNVFAGNQENDPTKEGEAANTNNTNRLNTVSSPVNAVSSSFTTIDPGRERAQRNEFESMFGQEKDANGNRMFTPVSAAGSTYVNLGGSIPVNVATLSNVDFPTDHLMPDLEDTADLQDTKIFSGAYDDEVEGAEADFNNLELTINPKGDSSLNRSKLNKGLQVMQRDDGIFISQDKYMADILKKFDFSLVKTTSTPIETNKAFLKDEEAEDVDVYLYRSIIESLMYLTASRPDIMDSPFDLEAFLDSDYAGASLDRKSTTGDGISDEFGIKTGGCKVNTARQKLVLLSQGKAKQYDCIGCDDTKVLRLTLGKNGLKLTFRRVTTGSVDISPASPTRRVSTTDDITMAETLVYIRRSATKTTNKEEKNKYIEVDQAKMLVDLINQRKRYFAKQKAKEKRKNPMTQAQQRTYIDAKEELDQGRSKKQKIDESSKPRNKDIDELSQKELQQLMIIVPEQIMNVKALQTKYQSLTGRFTLKTLRSIRRSSELEITLRVNHKFREGLLGIKLIILSTARVKVSTARAS
nr:hypothetical protein [Tanacetum cinerariifolium]